MTARRRAASVLFSTVVVLSALAVAVPAGAATDVAPADRIATDRPTLVQASTPITECTVIDQPGQYHLASNVSGNGTCLAITASDVTLDGQGHAVSDADRNHEGIGIEVNGTGRLSNVTITDIVLDGWYWNRFGKHGRNVQLVQVDDATITDVDIDGGDYGIRLTNVTNTTVERSDISGTDDPALYLESGSNWNRFADNQFTQGNKRGVMIHNSRNNTFHANEIAGFGDENVRLAWSADWNTFTDNHIHSTSWTSTCVSIGQSGSHLVFDNNTVAGCAGHALSLSQAGENQTITGNTINGSGGVGVVVSYTSNVTIEHNTIRYTEGHGINLKYRPGHVLRNNTITNVDRYGINFRDAHDSVAADNRISGVRQGGIRMIRGSSNNTVTGNTVRSYTWGSELTFPTAVRLRTADNNTFTDNDIESGYRGIEINDSANGNTLVDNTIYNANGSTWAFFTANADDTTVERLGVTSPTAPNTTLSFTARNVSITPNGSAPANPNAAGIGHVFEADTFGPPSYLDVRVHYEQRDRSGVDEGQLALWTHDGAWTEVGRSRVNPRDDTVGANLTSYSLIGAYATSDGESHTVTPTATATPQPTSTPASTDLGTSTPDDTEAATNTATTAATGTSATTSGSTATTTSGSTATTTTGTTATTSGANGTTTGAGPGFGALAALAALAGAVLLGRRRSR